MKHLYLNLKRFDVPVEYGGVNRLAPIDKWGSVVIEKTQDALKKYSREEAEFVQFFPEAHLLNALAALSDDSHVRVGCQGIYRVNTSVGENFGALTTNRPASAMSAMGVKDVLIGHCEERDDKNGILSEAGVNAPDAVNRILNREIKMALEEDMKVLYCIGEKSDEQDKWQDVLGAQLDIGLDDVDTSKVVIAYEPVWSVGPGKRPADREYITMIAHFVKEVTGGMEVVYGGGLKKENAAMLSSIDQIDGGLIALTRFDGETGFYPDEYLDIIGLYLGK